MMYSQSTGKLITETGLLLGIGYSGNDQFINEPTCQHIKMHGPLPQGKYYISDPVTDPKLGPLAMRLTPAPSNQMFGRAGFFIHGDNAEMNHTASDGCIVLNHDIRAVIAANLENDRTLIVVP